jgi:hypothetical protein
MSYALVVGTATTENKITEFRVLAVRRDLALEDAMRLLAERPAGTVGRIQRLPADLPAPGEVLQLDARGQSFNAPAAHRGQRQRDHAGGKP